MTTTYSINKAVDSYLLEVQKINRYLESKFSNSQLVSYKELSQFQVLVQHQLAEGVLSYKMPSVQTLMFPTKFDPLSDLGMHHHDCTEIIYVTKGQLINNLTSEKHYSHSILIVPAYELHSLSSGYEGCEIYVEFLEPKVVNS